MGSLCTIAFLHHAVLWQKPHGFADIRDSAADNNAIMAGRPYRKWRKRKISGQVIDHSYDRLAALENDFMQEFCYLNGHSCEGIDPAGGSKLRSSSKAHDITVASIVSTAPGVSLGTK